jgi:Protein of unknown function (DUF1353)
MARRHLTPKRHLGRELNENTVDVAKRLTQAMAQAVEAKPQAGAFEASAVEERAAATGAEILFEENREGPITSLAIILIPDENRQNRRVAALAATFGFVAHLSKRRKIAVAAPQGYVTDFASIPGFAQWMISPFGKHSEAAVVHDWLYTLGTKGDKKGRKLADVTFKKALKLVGVGWFRRNVMYLAVRVGGGSGYGLDSDYDFRDLERLKPRDPLPDRKSFAVTWKEMEIPKPVKKKKAQQQKKEERREQTAEPASSAAAPQPQTQEEAKQSMLEAAVSVKTD